MQSSVYYWEEHGHRWLQIMQHPTLGRFAFGDDKDWIMIWASSMGWLTEDF